MKSIVLEKMVLVDDSKNEICLCEKEFSKTCPTRIARLLPCAEAIVRITIVDRTITDDIPEDLSTVSARAIDSEVSDVNNNFARTLMHIDAMRK